MPLSTSFFLSHQAITARDSMAKSLYSALFDWIVLRINHALLNKKDMEESVPVRHKHSLAPTQKYLQTYTTLVDYRHAFPFLLLTSAQLVFSVLFSSVCPSVSWTFLVLRTLRPTALNSSASTTQTSSCSITLTITSSIWSR